ncbi:MAG TPA: DUF2007 domain-containing protein [Thermodesulfobacteriota bacterium]|nr:DUF2007 domain-containing protein [Thermodesulfobacteriota bacterium]
MDFKYRTTEEDAKTFIEIYRTDDVALAGLIKGVLDDNNIICYLDSYFFAHLYHPFVSPIKIMVYREDVEEAKNLLSLFFQAD